MLGTVFGSFANVCIYRIPRGMSIINPPSHCPNCKRKIPPYLNIPLISYIVLKGKCRYCNTRISPRYFIVELLSAGLLPGLFILEGLSVDFIISVVFFEALLIASFIDIEHMVIPDSLSIGSLVLMLAVSPLREGLEASLKGTIFGAGLIMFIAFAYKLARGIEGMGFGDVKLMGAIGAFAGWKGALLTLFYASFLGAIVGFLVALRKGLRYPMPFGPFLSIGVFAWVLQSRLGFHFPFFM